MNQDRAFGIDCEHLVRLRVQALEALQRESARASARCGSRVYKVVFIIDVEATSYSLFKSNVMAFARRYAAVTETMYADAVWTNLVVNAPSVARCL